MLIGICGSICSGKSTVARYLVEHHGFKLLHISPSSASESSSDDGGGGDSQTAPLSSFTGVGRGIGGLSARNHSSSTGQARRSPSLALEFPDATALLDFVTKRWQERWVTIINGVPVLDLLGKRPFFLLISVDAPVTVRFRRYQQRQEKQRQQRQEQLSGAGSSGEDAAPSLAWFVGLSDAQLFDPVKGQTELMSRAAAQLLNTSSSVAHLFATLGKIDLPNEDRLRPSWDSYFMSLASLAAQRSNCMKRRVGCVLVRERRVVSTGYNGTPRGLRNCGEGGCGRCNEGLSSGVGLATCLCIHAEENALLEAGRDRIREGSTLYCDTCPCLTCSIKIAQVGISEVVYSQGYSMDNDTAAVLREAGVKLRQFVPPANGLIHMERTELYN